MTAFTSRTGPGQTLFVDGGLRVAIIERELVVGECSYWSCMPSKALIRPGAVGAYTQAFGRADLDASNLMLAITGFLPGDDPRMKATIDATAARLTDERGLVYRYLAHDGLAGEEGTFLLCTFWLAQAQALAGAVQGATATFERAVAAINDVGLLAEEVDANSGEMIGNVPQAFSHIGLVNAAWAITQARQRADRHGPAAVAAVGQALGERT
jgi:GH15 family glucan-1,4-alpha-glucosidase